jgi:hypothetical protein
MKDTKRVFVIVGVLFVVGKPKLAFNVFVSVSNYAYIMETNEQTNKKM